jgi:hypothetical protein
LRRALSREVRHIIRQRGNFIEEIIAIRSGRLVKYVKKDNRGAVTCGSYRMANSNKQVSDQKEKVSVDNSADNKEGLLSAILRVMNPDKTADAIKKKGKK